MEWKKRKSRIDLKTRMKVEYNVGNGRRGLEKDGMEEDENRIENKKRRRTSMGMKGRREDRMERLGEENGKIRRSI